MGCIYIKIFKINNFNFKIDESVQKGNLKYI